MFRSYARYIALVPQTEEADKNDGFRIIHLPIESEFFSLFVFNFQTHHGNISTSIAPT